MGHVLSSTGKLQEVLDLLEQEDCGQMHEIWQQLTIRDLIKIEDEEKMESILLSIKRKRPGNFGALVKCVADVFSKGLSSIILNPKAKFLFAPSCQFLCLLISISGDPPQRSAWFKSPPTYLTSTKPIFSIIQTFSSLLEFKRPPEEIIKDLADCTDYTRTLLFLIHCGSFHETVHLPDPSQYLLAFDVFPSAVYVPSLFKIISLVFAQRTKDQKLISFIRAQMSFALPCLYSCQSWKKALINMNSSDIHDALSSIFSLSSQVIICAEQLIALLYVVLNYHKEYINYLDNNNFTNRYIISILFLYQEKTENHPVTFLHSIILLTLCAMTSTIPSLLRLNEPFESDSISPQRQHNETVADKLIEIMINPAIKNFAAIAPITPLVAGIISNISATTVNLSLVAAKRLFVLLKLFLASRAAEKKEYMPTIEKILASIFSFTRYQTVANHSLLQCLIDNKALIVSFAQSRVDQWEKYANYLLPIIEAAEEPMAKSANSSNHKKKVLDVHNSISPILAKFKDTPNLPRVEFRMTYDIEVIWFDWFRVMLWQLFPDDAQFYDLHFVSFSLAQNEPKNGQKQKQEQKQKQSCEINKIDEDKKSNQFENTDNVEIDQEEEEYENDEEAEVPSNTKDRMSSENPFVDNGELKKFLDDEDE